MSPKYRSLIILLSLFLAIRMLIVFSSIAHTIHHHEMCLGTPAKILTENIKVPILKCVDTYRWGSYIFSFLAVPFFFVLGDSLIALRSAATFVSLCMLIVLYIFLFDFFNKRTAILASLLFILSPPLYIKMSYVCTGSYAELNCLSLLTIFIFYKIFFMNKNNQEVPRSSNNKYLYALFGFLCGFGLLYDYPFLLTILCCLLFWFIFDKRFLLKQNFYIFFALFLIGFSPWLFYNIAYHWNGVFVIHGRSIWQWFTSNSPAKSLAQFITLFVFEIPGFFDFNNLSLRGFLSIKGTYISYAYYFLFLISFISIFWLNRKSIAKLLLGIIPLARFKISSLDISRDTFLIIYSIIFCLIYSLLNFPIFPGSQIRENIIAPYRYVFPLQPFIFIIMAIFLDKISKNVNKYSHFIFYSFTAVLILIGSAGSASLIDVSSFKINFIPKGYNYVRYGKQIKSVCIFKNDIDQCLSCIEKFGKQDRRFVYDGYEWATQAGLPDIKAYAERVLQRIDKEYWPFAYERLGEALEKIFWSDGTITRQLEDNLQQNYLPYVYRGMGRELSRNGGIGDITKYLSLRNKIDEKYRPYFCEGIGIELDDALIKNTRQITQFLSNIDEVDQKFIFMGFGKGKEYTEISYVQLFIFGFGRLGYDLGRWNSIMDGIKEKLRPDCYRRLGIEVGWRFIHGIREYRSFLEKTEERYRPSLYKGLGIGIGWRFGDNMDDCMLILRQFDQRFLPYLYEGLGIGVARRRGYQLEELKQEISKVPAEYRFCLERGIKETFNERHEIQG